MLEKQIIEDLVQRQGCFDQLCSVWCAEYRQRGGSILCGVGCGGCCSLVVNCSFPEAVLLAESLTPRQVEQLKARIPWIKRAAQGAATLKDWLSAYRSEGGPCPFLDPTGSCGVYPVRPISCRSLFSTKSPQWCTTNFAEIPGPEKQAFMESLDRSAVAFPTHYAATPQEIGSELEEVTLRQMESEYGFAIIGCLPWLVWLELEHRMSSRLAGGVDGIEEYLEERGLSDPYLLIFT